VAMECCQADDLLEATLLEEQSRGFAHIWDRLWGV
jgi:hypothetical protein